MRGRQGKAMRAAAAIVPLLFVLGASLHLGQHGRCAGHDPSGGAPGGDESGCLACQVLAGGLVETAAPVLPEPALEFVSLVADPVQAVRRVWLSCFFARGPPA